jgi:methylmalonyl-CoA mutase C-terminal domain/subunit
VSSPPRRAQRSFGGRDGRPEVSPSGCHAGGPREVVPPGQTQTRILLAKPGLDGHDRGKVIAFALRDAGAEVIYLGLRQQPAAIIASAIAEDADLIGISVLSGAHLPLAEQILAQRADQGAEHIPVVIGGTIPAAHVEALRRMGVDAVYPVGSPLAEVVTGLLAMADGSGASWHRASAAAAGAQPMIGES